MSKTPRVIEPIKNATFEQVVRAIVQPLPGKFQPEARLNEKPRKKPQEKKPTK